jgi:hypothetical protein
VEKARDDRKHASILISQAYEIGQFYMDSAKMVSSYWDVLKEESEEDG